MNIAYRGPVFKANESTPKPANIGAADETKKNPLLPVVVTSF